MRWPAIERNGNPMTRYFRVMLGKGSMHAADCFSGGFIGVDFDLAIDLTNKLPENWRDFNAKFRDIWLKTHANKTKVAAGLACGMLWTICKGIKKGDVMLPFRIMLVGGKFGPGVFAIADLITKENCIKRIQNALEQL